MAASANQVNLGEGMAKANARLAIPEDEK